MKKSHIFFGLAILFVAIYGIDKYGSNSDCYEIVPPQGGLNTMLLDKCKGQTSLIVREETDEDGDGKMDGYLYRWTRMGINHDGEVMWKGKLK